MDVDDDGQGDGDSRGPKTSDRANESPYAALAPIYDDWQARYGRFSAHTLRRIEPILAGQAVEAAEPSPATSFVDLGCGTGSLLLDLRARHPTWRLAGCDASPEMLAVARQKPGAEGVAWHCVRLGFSPSVPDGPFDVAGAFFNTLNHLTSTHELEAALAAIANALRPGGLFLFDVNNEEGFRAWWQGSPQVYDGPGWELEISSHFDESARTAQADLRIGRSLPAAASSLSSAAVMRHETTTVYEALFADVEIRDALLRTGFEEIASEPWAPFPDGVPGATFWTARR